jgi:N-hydroxyarylamine O-acetyltransferase
VLDERRDATALDLAMTLDLDRYFARIGWATDPAPDLATLSGLVAAHVAAIPFENLDVLLGTPISLELDAVSAKLIDRRRGGYCYEHATLFGAVLERLGFTVRAHSARVTMATPKHAAPRTHMLLSVELPEGAYVVDPGFGGLAPRVPVPLDGSPAGDHWLARDAGEYTLNVRTPDGVVAAWVTPLVPEYPIDFVLANHFTSTHPASSFTQRMMLRAFTGPDSRVTVRNRDVTRWRGDIAEPSVLADRDELRALLAADFGFDLDVSRLRVPDISDW